MTPLETNNSQPNNGKENLQKSEIVFSDDVRFKDLKNLPQKNYCKFCGKNLLTKGIMINPLWITWFENPEFCTCENAINEQLSIAALQQSNAENILKRETFLKMKSEIKKLIGTSGLSERAKNCTFENYFITEQNKNAHNAGLNFVSDFSKNNHNKYGLFIAGNIGVGKSFLAFCVANCLLLKGFSVYASTPEDLLNNIKRSYDNNNKSEYEILKIYKNVDLLILDDIGKEELTEWGLAKLNNILYYRHENFKSVILTTNYNDDLLVKRISPNKDDLTTAKSIIDRLYQTCNAIIITGKSWRTKNV